MKRYDDVKRETKPVHFEEDCPVGVLHIDHDYAAINKKMFDIICDKLDALEKQMSKMETDNYKSFVHLRNKLIWLT